MTLIVNGEKRRRIKSWRTKKRVIEQILKVNGERGEGWQREIDIETERDRVKDRYM